jgi:hypothetical protein
LLIKNQKFRILSNSGFPFDFSISPSNEQVNRPLAMKKEGIQTRKRKPKAATPQETPQPLNKPQQSNHFSNYFKLFKLLNSDFIV